MDRRRNEALDRHHHLHPQTHIPGKDSNPDPYPSPLPIATISSPSNSKTPPLLPPPPPPPPAAVRYSECLKNHAVSTGGHVIDGCGEFMPAGEEGSPEALKCAACDCHRNFHRREYEGVSQIKSAANSFYPYNPNRNSTILRTTTTTHLTQVPPPLPPPPPHHNNHRYSQGLSTSAFMMAFGGASGAPAESSSEDLNMFHSYNVGTQQLMTQPPFSRKKRFRTKFTQEQKDGMEEIAERLGWKIQKQDEEEVEKFCGEVGVKKQAFKVWIHNNKQSMKKKQL
ncbi:zinc-finger homeodomain protein 6 [Camellia sinensis]|uniref:zinc-finger homeodomain protein 6 n=1 Tax=Camellia sinensis TaxID=4442 RepID=UPI0010361ACF|nr:zinc-finger homeodomain protein 6 [Camellia sinensis]